MPSIIKGSDNFNSKPYASFPIGVPFALWDHMVAAIIPDNQGDVKFIKLTAGLDGAGQFNEGLLINETITGSSPTIEITAEIAIGPLAGNVIHLINSENRYLMPGESSGAIANDQMQHITGSLISTTPNTFGVSPAITDAEGAFTESGNARSFQSSQLIGTDRPDRIDFDSSLSPNARTGDHTNVKRIETTYYMRIV